MDLIIRLLDSSIDLDRFSAALLAVLDQQGYWVVAIGFAGDLDRSRDLIRTRGEARLETEFVQLPGPERPTEFWIAYPPNIGHLNTVAERIRASWGKGATEEEALERAGGKWRNKNRESERGDHH